MNWARSIRALATVGLLTQVSLYSWSMGTEHPTPTSRVPQSFPFSLNQQWFTEESYLLWKPYMENMWYGNKDTFEQIDATNFSDKIKVKSPEFEWSSGGRFTIGRYLANHDLWDVAFTTTYLYSQTGDDTDANINNNVGFNASFLPHNAVTPLPSGEGSFNWRLNYFTFDLAVGRLFTMTPKIVFHPYFGVRGSLQYQHAKAKASGVTTAPNGDFTSSLSTNGSSRIDNDFWGVGPRVGTSFLYYFANHFSFNANISAALLVGAQKLKNNSSIDSVTTINGISTFTDTDAKSDDSLNVIRSNIETSVGIGWEKWLNNNTVRIAPSVNLEGSLWFAMNQLYNFYSGGDVQHNAMQRRHGNLGLMGLSFNLQVDF